LRIARLVIYILYTATSFFGYYVELVDSPPSAPPGGGLKIREVKRDRMQRAFGGTSQTLKTVNIQIDPGQAPENAGS
jgi:hypothetical protein